MCNFGVVSIPPRRLIHRHCMPKGFESPLMPRRMSLVTSNITVRIRKHNIQAYNRVIDIYARCVAPATYEIFCPPLHPLSMFAFQSREPQITEKVNPLERKLCHAKHYVEGWQQVVWTFVIPRFCRMLWVQTWGCACMPFKPHWNVNAKL